jgi:hypothetical protein
MSTKLEKNLRKIIIKNFNQKNASNPLFKNKKLPKIKITNEIPTQTNENKKYIKRKSKTDANILHNDYKILLKNNNTKIDSTEDNSNANMTPKRNKKENKMTLKKVENKLSKNEVLKTPKIFSKKISLSEIYKLPAILNKDYKTIKLNLSNKQPINRLINNKIYISQGKTLSPNINSSSNEKNSESKEMKEKMPLVITGMNNNFNNFNINIIDYNKICVKKNSRPLNIVNRNNNFSNFSVEPRNTEENLLQYMKDRYYIDTEAKMSKKLKGTVFNHDNSLKEKIIKMKKISGFWGGLADYCIPIFSIRKFQYIKERLKQRKSESKKEKNLEENEMKIKYDIKPSRLFTINSVLDYKHQKNLEIKKEFIEKYNDSLEYYMI